MPAAFALVLSLAPAAGERAEASCRCAGGELDLVVVLDTTGSMQHLIGTLKAQLIKILTVLRGRIGTLRVGVVSYKAHEASGQGLSVVETQPLTTDFKQVTDFLYKSKAVGGGFEAVELGMAAAINDIQWTKGSRKVLVLLGDEPCAEAREALCVKLAGEAKEKGIAVNTVTGSETAWRYYAMLHEQEWKRKLEQEGEHVRTKFRIPLFVEMAEAGGGIAVSSNDSRDLVMWLLAFGLGLKPGQEKDIDLDAYFRWTEPDDVPGKDARKAGGPPPRHLVGWVRHGGHWNVPHDFPCLISRLKSRIELAGESEARPVALTDAGLSSFPILYMTGHGAAALTDEDVRNLATYLRAGGFLFADACCGDRQFDESFRKLMDKAFGEGALRRLPADHPIFRSGYEMKKVRFDPLPRAGDFKEVEPELFGVAVDGRLAVAYSARDLGCCWMTLPMGIPCQHHDEDGLALSANVLLHALTH